ncbi:GHKL domain-containing protein [Aquimarina sp. ERC-38]|uniref:GHKL domain-containing protein n=1 Tax=Aquimarina sp. ERC-38 TaxID=2949996 RepID=UPI003A599BA5
MVENAFKHGVSGSIEKPEVRISLEQAEDFLKFVVWNTNTSEINNKTDHYKSGIGLVNIKRQLDLIYPDAHELKVEETEQFFELTLILKIT